MVVQTPLEKALESELNVIGVPFKERTLYHETLFKRHIVVQQYGQEDLEQMSPLVRGEIRKRQKTIDYFQVLIHRSTAWSSAKKLSVSYTIFPSGKNIAEFQKVMLGEMPEIVDRMLEERSFATEQVQVHDNAHCPITQELLNKMKEDERSHGLTRGYLKRMIANNREEERGKPEEIDYGESHFLYVEFEKGKLATDHGCDVPSNLLEGIVSPIEHAALLAQRISGFIAMIEGAE